MPRTPDICPTFTPQADKITALIEQYGETLKVFEVEGTPEIAQELDRLKTEILALKENINKTLEPLGYDLDNPPMSESADEIDAKLKALGSPATLDRNIENGVVRLTLDQETMKSLRTYGIAITAFNFADSTTTYIYEALKNIPWQVPTSTNLDVLVLNHGETTSVQRDVLVEHMKSLGYRPLTLAELVALGITRPDLNKRNEVLNTYEKHTLDDALQSPCFRWGGGARRLDAVYVSDGWSGSGRFLFVRI